MKKEFRIEGMHCKSCEVLIKESLEDELKGIKSVNISAAKGDAVIEFNEKETTFDEIKRIIKREGYKVK